MKLDYSAIWESIVANKIVFIALGLIVLLVIVAMWMSDCGSNWKFRHGVSKQQQAIANNIDTIKNANAQIANLEQQKAAAQANVNAAVKDYQDAVYGLDNAKVETNKALANLNKAINTNANIDATADDVMRAVNKLNEQ